MQIKVLDTQARALICSFTFLHFFKYINKTLESVKKTSIHLCNI